MADKMRGAERRKGVGELSKAIGIAKALLNVGKRGAKEFYKEDAKLLEEKIELAREVFEWRDHFYKTPECKKLFNLLPGKIRLFGGEAWGKYDSVAERQYGKKYETRGITRWSWVYLNRDGSFHYAAGVNVGSYYTCTSFNTPSELVKLNHGYLRALRNCVCGEEIYVALAGTILRESGFKCCY